jgi:hypothetical protein
MSYLEAYSLTCPEGSAARPRPAMEALLHDGKVTDLDFHKAVSTSHQNGATPKVYM